MRLFPLRRRGELVVHIEEAITDYPRYKGGKREENEHPVSRASISRGLVMMTRCMGTAMVRVALGGANAQRREIHGEGQTGREQGKQERRQRDGSKRDCPHQDARHGLEGSEQSMAQHREP